MVKTFLIARREYIYYLQKKSFLFSAFGVPILIAVVMAISILLSTQGNTTDLSGTTRYGYVDLSEEGIMSDETIRDLYGETFQRYGNEEAARAALDSEEIPVYFVISSDYMASGSIKLYSYGGVPKDMQYHIDRLLISSVSATVAEGHIPVERIMNPVEATIRIEDSGREMSPESFIPLIITPIVFAVVFMMAMQITGSFLMAGLVEEKENRIMEIMVTSVTPLQLLSGKIIGLGLLGLTQLAAWIIAGIVLFVVGTNVEALEGLTFPIDLVVLAVLYFLLGYALIAAIMAGIGAVAGSEQESRQYAGIFSLVFAVPYFFIIAFINDPNGTAPVILSIIPFTAPMAMVMRSGLTVVPLWHILLSIALLLVTIALFVWIAAKIFRWGLLLYGKSPRPRDLFRVLRGNVDPGTISRPADKKEVSA